jgi:hypothetical protein
LILIKPGHPSNAQFPILVTEAGISMLVRLVHLRNAPSPIFVTGRPSISAGITSVAALPVYSVMVAPPFCPRSCMVRAVTSAFDRFWPFFVPGALGAAPPQRLSASLGRNRRRRRIWRSLKTRRVPPLRRLHGLSRPSDQPLFSRVHFCR